MRRLFILVVANLASIGCSRRPDPQPISLRGVSYEFPQRDIDAMSLPHGPKETLFVRLHPPLADYHLILDELSHYAANNQGSGVPTISRLNDNRFGKFAVTNGPRGLIICSTGPQPYFNCGFRVDDGPVRWSVLFDRKRLWQAERIHAQGRAAIRSYHARG
jgi:hypothetical protein